MSQRGIPTIALHSFDSILQWPWGIIICYYTLIMLHKLMLLSLKQSSVVDPLPPGHLVLNDLICWSAQIRRCYRQLWVCSQTGYCWFTVASMPYCVSFNIGLIVVMSSYAWSHVSCTCLLLNLAPSVWWAAIYCMRTIHACNFMLILSWVNLRMWVMSLSQLHTFTAALCLSSQKCPEVEVISLHTVWYAAVYALMRC